MELISKLIEIALYELQSLSIIDWTPEDGAPETFIAECDIEYNKYIAPWTGGDFFVMLCGAFIIVDTEHWEAWHSSCIETAS